MFAMLEPTSTSQRAYKNNRTFGLSWINVVTLELLVLKRSVTTWLCIVIISFKQPPRIIKFRDFKNFNQEITADLFGIKWIGVVYIQNIDDKVKFITDNVIMLFDHHFSR
nr:unnamed protein product [Callosobruchus analis]